MNELSSLLKSVILLGAASLVFTSWLPVRSLREFGRSFSKWAGAVWCVLAAVLAAGLWVGAGVPVPVGFVVLAVMLIGNFIFLNVFLDQEAKKVRRIVGMLPDWQKYLQNTFAALAGAGDLFHREDVFRLRGLVSNKIERQYLDLTLTHFAYIGQVVDSYVAEMRVGSHFAAAQSMVVNIYAISTEDLQSMATTVTAIYESWLRAPVTEGDQGGRTGGATGASLDTPSFKADES